MKKNKKKIRKQVVTINPENLKIQSLAPMLKLLRF
jgi:hypothetical protein